MFPIHYILLFVALSLVWSCSEPVPIAEQAQGEISGSGILITRDSKPGAFTNIHTSGPITTDVRAGEVQKMRITADHNVINNVLSEVRGDTLYLSLQEGQYHNIWVSVQVYIPQVQSITNAGSGSMKLSKIFSGHPPHLVNSGTGTLWIEGKEGDLYLQNAGIQSLGGIDPGEAGGGTKDQG